LTDTALSGISVLDLSNGMSGAYCTKVLRDLGADVIKIEAPISGDPTRRMGPFLNGTPNIETSATFLYLNAGKQSVTLDLESEEGAKILKELATKSDVLVESFKPSVMDSLGLGYSELEKVNPGLVMASISYFGGSGPYRDYEGSDLVAYAVSGYMYLTGDEDREPMKAGGSQSEYQAGLAGAMSIMAALTHRDFTGEGQHIDVSTIESLNATFDGLGFYSAYENRGVVAKRAGTRLVQREPHGAYPSTLLPCKDGWVHVHYSPSNPEGIAMLTGDERMESDEVLSEMRGHADEIDASLTEWLRDHTREEIQTLAQEIRVPFTMVQSIPEVLDDPQNTARGFFVEIEHPEAGDLRYLTSPFRLPESPWRAVRAPMLGEHTIEVLSRELGYSDDKLQRLKEANVI
jgi:crotonobetainyl-CoA:carnitine CoA-transferase CaiB-like acyl-CoA transferase